MTTSSWSTLAEALYAAGRIHVAARDRGLPAPYHINVTDYRDVVVMQFSEPDDLIAWGEWIGAEPTFEHRVDGWLHWAVSGEVMDAKVRLVAVKQVEDVTHLTPVGGAA